MYKPRKRRKLMIYEVTVLCFSQETFSQPQRNQRPHPISEPHPHPGCLQQPARRAHPTCEMGRRWEGGHGGGQHPPFTACSCVSRFAEALDVFSSHNTAGGKTLKKKTEKSPSRNINPQVFMLIIFCHMKWNWKPRVQVPFMWRKFCPSKLVERMMNDFSWHQANLGE